MNTIETDEYIYQRVPVLGPTDAHDKSNKSLEISKTKTENVVSQELGDVHCHEFAVEFSENKKLAVHDRHPAHKERATQS